MPAASEPAGVSVDRWERFYEERDYDRCAYLAGEEMVDHVEAFFESVGVPDSLASVGCGPAVTELAIAERYPDTSVACYDAADRVVRDDRAVADERGLENISFEVATLPGIDLGRRFEHVYCLATLYFVEDVERALRALYDHVEPGGILVVSYPDEDLRAWVREQDESKREFFELVAAGENLLTQGEVEELLDARVEDFWTAVGAEDDDEAATVFLRR